MLKTLLPAAFEEKLKFAQRVTLFLWVHAVNLYFDLEERGK
jgi:hypothetical protein